MIPGAAFVPGTTKPVIMNNVHSAVFLACLFLGLATVMILPRTILPLGIVFLGIALRWTGLRVFEQVQLVKPWWPMSLIVLTVHTVTGCVSAGQLVMDGVISGLVTLNRILLCLGLLSFFLRISTLEDSIIAVHYWLRPLRIFGVQTRHLGLVLAVALGTAPVVLEEGKRIRAVVRMRRGQVDAEGFFARLSRLWNGILEWGHILLPVMESLGRRADTLSLSLVARMPSDSDGHHSRNPGVCSLVALTFWLLGLIGIVVFPVMRG